MPRTKLIEVGEIDFHNVRQFLCLTVRGDQSDLVASNAVTIAQAHYEPYCWMRGIWLAGNPVGLVALVDNRSDHPSADVRDPENAAYLWRLMVDARYQREGIGTQIMAVVFEQARNWGRGILFTGVAVTDGNAKGFYEQFGLQATGRIDDGEEFLVTKIPSRFI